MARGRRTAPRPRTSPNRHRRTGDVDAVDGSGDDAALVRQQDVDQILGTHAETVTRRNVAEMEVASGLVFWLLNRASSSCCRSVARPFFSAASKAFMVGP